MSQRGTTTRKFGFRQDPARPGPALAGRVGLMEARRRE